MKISVKTYDALQFRLLGFCFLFTLVFFIPEFLDGADPVFLAMEDGFVEYTTVLFLIASVFLCISRFRTMNQSPRFIYLGLGFLIFFVAGEEMSWGQRIFDYDVPEYFLVNNSQKETNLHNMIFGGYRLNTVVFGNPFEFVAMLALLLSYYLHIRSPATRAVCLKYAIPFPEFSLIMMYVLSMMLIYLMEHSKRWEVMELTQSIAMFLVLLKPTSEEHVSSVGRY